MWIFKNFKKSTEQIEASIVMHSPKEAWKQKHFDTLIQVIGTKGLHHFDHFPLIPCKAVAKFLEEEMVRRIWRPFRLRP